MIPHIFLKKSNPCTSPTNTRVAEGGLNLLADGIHSQPAKKIWWNIVTSNHLNDISPIRGCVIAGL